MNPLESGHVPYSLLDPTGVNRIIDSLYSGAGQRRQVSIFYKKTHQMLSSFVGIHGMAIYSHLFRNSRGGVRVRTLSIGGN